MKRIFIAVALFLCASPLSAQVSQARFDSLAARVAMLDSIVGTRGFLSPQILCSQMEARRPSAWFPNGEYDLAYRNRQFGCAFDPLSTVAYGLGVRMAGVEQRLAAVEGNGANNPPSSVSNFVSGDLILRGRLCIVPASASTCLEDNAGHIQIVGQNPLVHFKSNIAGTQWQSPAAHDGWIGLSDDGGLRYGINSKLSVSTFTATDPTNGQVYQSSLRTSLNPARAYAYAGFDSGGQLCWYIQQPGRTHEYTQDVCWRTYEDQKVLTLELWRPGWQLKFAESSGFRTIDKWFAIPPQQ